MAAGKDSLWAGQNPSVWAGLLLLLVGPVSIAMLLFQANELEPASLPYNGPWVSLAVPAHNNRMLRGSEGLGNGLLPGPEDLAYDPEAQVIYTGCADGWIKRVNITDSGHVSVDNWVHVAGGRPLGLALSPEKQLIVADAYKGLLRVTREGVVVVLTEEAEGVRFRLPDGVDLAGDGVVYFTDASYKYNLEEFVLDALEGRPYGRLMSFDPSTNETRVLVRDLYFANGVAVSPENDFLVFCETILGRCRKYHIHGEKKGLVENFIDNLPGFPDNIHYDGEGCFWIALTVGRTYFVDMLMRSRLVRKVWSIWGNTMSWIPQLKMNGGVLAVSLEGEVVALYSDPGLFSVTSGVKIGRHIYYGSLLNDYVSRFDLKQHAGRAT
ncbi:protein STRICTOSIDINE SYNTHASE-LIKE 6-like [Tasmannia lanceolata]|uniref:protein STRICTOSIDINE SYNTHASE-LIKE 6-like n=1 Tax=Tasmannia lanceolata TaxID=3420 RepID=UPI0040641CCF